MRSTDQGQCRWIILRNLARRGFAACLLVTAGVIAALIIVEGLARAFHLAEFELNIDEPHPLYGWRHVPGATALRKAAGRTIPIQMNSKGLRDREIPYDKPTGAYRILVLGDSMVDATQILSEETFPKRLESLLIEGGGGRRFEVVNAGAGGYGTDNELLFFRHEGRKYQPDLVLLAFSIVTDVYDNSAELLPVGTPGKPTKPWFVLEGEHLRLLNFPCDCTRRIETGPIALAKAFLRSHSLAYLLAKRGLIENLPRLADAMVGAGLVKPLYRQTSYLMVDGIPLAYWNFSAEQSPVWQRAWRLTGKLLVKLKEEVEGQHGRLLVISIPAGEQVYGDLWRKALDTYPNLRRHAWDLDKPDRILTGLLQESKIPYLNLVPHLRRYSESGGKGLYVGTQEDHHLSAEGHAVVAELMYRFLIAEDALVRGSRNGRAQAVLQRVPTP